MKAFLSTLIIVLAGSISLAQTQISTPFVQCSNVTITNITTNSFKVNWSLGSGDRSIVIVKPAGNAVSAPVNAAMGSYVASTVYGSGANLGNSNYVITKTVGGTNVTVTGLSSGVNYEAIVYSYNYGCLAYNSLLGCYGGNGYLVKTTYSSANSEDHYTLSTEPTGAPTISVIGTPGVTTASFSIIGGTGASWSLMSARESNITGYSPVDGSSYSPASTSFSSGVEVGGTGSKNYATYYSSATGNVNLTNLKPATGYYARVYAFNGNGVTGNYSYNYKTDAYAQVYFSTYNTPPTINAISSLTLCENAATQTVNVSGMTDGSAVETQTLYLYATSSNTTLIQNITVNYTSPNSTGNLVFTPTSNQYGSSTITVWMYDSGPNNYLTQQIFTVTVLPPPDDATNIVSTNTLLCQQKTGVTFSVSPIANATGYSWTLPSGATIVSGANTNSITVDFNTTISSGFFIVRGTNANGCGNGGGTPKFVVNFDKVPTTAVAGPNQQICTGTALLAGNTPIIGNAIWTLGSGSAIISTPTVAASSITGIANNGTVTAVWTVTNGVCPASVSTVTIANIFGSPSCNPNADFYSNNVSPCINTPIVYYSNSIGATSYTWNFGATATPSVFTSGSTTSVSVTYTSAGLKSATLTINSSGGPDTETKINYVNVISAPTTPTIISGNSSVCQGETDVNYSTSAVLDATAYNWSFASGLSQNTGGTSNAISINASTTAVTGTIGVNASNACGTSGTRTLNIIVNPLPTQASAITGSNTVCQGVSNVVYVATALNNATSIIWTVPSGVSVVSGLNTRTLTVSYGNNSTSGTMSVFGSNTCGDGAIRNKAITVNLLPGSAGLITGSTNNETCPLSTNVHYSIAPVSSATSYAWVVPMGYTGSSTTNSIFLNTTLNSVDGVIKVVGKNACGHGDTSNVLNVDVVELPLQQVCVATVDSTSQYNEIIWQKTGSVNIDSFKVYRMQSLILDTLIETVPYANIARVVDVTSNPNVTSYSYKISAVDACGNEGAKSPLHQTIHLQSIYSQAQNKTDLSWNLYDGATVNNYRVLRDTNNSGNWVVLINNLAPNATSYTDFTIPVGAISVQYRVDVIWGFTCDPTAKVASFVNTSKSNTKDFVVDGEPTYLKNGTEILNSIAIYPNPTQNKFTITMQTAFEKTEIVVMNQFGAIIKQQTMNYTDSEVVDISNLSSGIYFVTVKTPIGAKTKRITKL